MFRRQKNNSPEELEQKALDGARFELKKILSPGPLAKKELKLDKFLTWWDSYPTEIKREILKPTTPSDPSLHEFSQELSRLHKEFPYPYDRHLPEILETIQEWRPDKKKKNETDANTAYNSLAAILNENSNLNQEGKLRALLNWWGKWDDETKFQAIFMSNGDESPFHELGSVLAIGSNEHTGDAQLREVLEQFFAMVHTWDSTMLTNYTPRKQRKPGVTWR